MTNLLTNLLGVAGVTTNFMAYYLISHRHRCGLFLDAACCFIWLTWSVLKSEWAMIAQSCAWLALGFDALRKWRRNA